VKAFFRRLDRAGHLHNPTLALARAPKVPRRVPRPLTRADAVDAGRVLGIDEDELDEDAATDEQAR
jgi:hypothetical protein